jgi:peptidoglycan hydrolase-like protein with peptidoglycan-binding domain
MDTFDQLMGTQNWGLALPVTVRGVRVDRKILTTEEPERVSDGDASERTLMLQTPFMVEDEVEAVQRALVQAGISVDADGIYGYLAEAAARRFQQLKGLTAEGIADPATRSALGL